MLKLATAAWFRHKNSNCLLLLCGLMKMRGKAENEFAVGITMTIFASPEQLDSLEPDKHPGVWVHVELN